MAVTADWEAAHAKGDYVAAVALVRPRAEAGDAAAQFGLAQMYEGGQGVAVNDAEAARWYGLAAAQGHAQAQFYLGQIYANGDTSKLGRDYVAAYVWWTRASRQGHPGATSGLRSLGKIMTAADLAEAKKQLAGD